MAERESLYQFPADSAMGNPSPAQVAALLGPELFEDVDVKDKAAMDAAWKIARDRLFRIVR